MFFEKAHILFKRITSGEIHCLISGLTMVEICGAVARIANHDEAMHVYGELIKLEQRGLLEILPIIEVERASAIAIELGIKGADAVIVQTAKRNNAKLCTFDEEMIKKAKGIVEFYSMP